MLFSETTFAQITATHFNAGWNEANGVSWFMDLEDCRTKGITDIAKHPDDAKKYKIAVVPTIIIFKDGEEAARFQADIAEAKELPIIPPDEVTRMEFNMKDQMIRNTILDTQKDVEEIKKSLEKIEDKLYDR